MASNFLPRLLIVLLIVTPNLWAQATTRAVPASEVNGTFRSYFKGRFSDSANEIKILALGKGRLKVSFDLVYPYVDGNGELSANIGEIDGFATISGNTAVFASDEFGRCRINIRFVRTGTIEVFDTDGGSGCGFGFNVSAGGRYKRVSKLKPKF